MKKNAKTSQGYVQANFFITGKFYVIIYVNLFSWQILQIFNLGNFDVRKIMFYYPIINTLIYITGISAVLFILHSALHFIMHHSFVTRCARLRCTFLSNCASSEIFRAHDIGHLVKLLHEWNINRQITSSYWLGFVAILFRYDDTLYMWSIHVLYILEFDAE